MQRINVALAAGFGLVLTATSVSAQNESRGYGGPLYVGPNFEKGGQHTTPDYGFKSSKKAVVKREVVKPHKAPPRPQKEVATEKEPTPAVETATPTTAERNSTASTSTATAASTTPLTCKKFDSTAGQTITVPCQ